MAESQPSARPVAAAHSLYVNVVTAEVVEALRFEGIPSILLRGPSILRHLYDGGELREYTDADLLVAPADLDAARRILASRGFEAIGEERTDDPPRWARSWLRTSDGAEVDLHRTLAGADAVPEEVWMALRAHLEPIDVARTAVDGLDAEATSLVVALHAAHHGVHYPKPLADVSRALDRFSDRTWEQAALLAERVQATPAFAAGLRLLPAGAEFAERLSLPIEASTEVVLRASTAPPTALGFDRLAQTSGLPAKLRLLAASVFPSPAFVKAWAPGVGLEVVFARRSRLVLVVAYLYRPFWLIWHAGPGFRAWLSARGRARH